MSILLLSLIDLFTYECYYNMIYCKSATQWKTLFIWMSSFVIYAFLFIQPHRPNLEDMYGGGQAAKLLYL